VIVTIDRADTRDVPGLRALFARLDELSALQADWDSYGGLPPTARSIGAASRLIVEVAAHTQVLHQSTRCHCPMADYSSSGDRARRSSKSTSALMVALAT
jgi:hypothetical protein